MTADTPTRPTTAEAIAWGDRIMSLPGSDHDASPLSVLVDLARDGQRLRELRVQAQDVLRETLHSPEHLPWISVEGWNVNTIDPDDYETAYRLIEAVAAEPVTPSAEVPGE